MAEQGDCTKLKYCLTIVRERERALYELAESQGGYFDLQQARQAGYSAQLLGHHQQQGRVLRIRRGIYRLQYFPVGEAEDLMVPWLWSERTGVFSHETALALYQLSDTLPGHVDLTVPLDWKKRRLRVPPGLILHFDDVPAEERTWRDYIPVVTAARAVVDCARDHRAPDIVWDALMQGLERRLFRRERVAEALEYCAPYRSPSPIPS